jgi:hypothetical protein
MQFENSVNIQGRKQGSLEATEFVLLNPGVYAIWSETDTFIQVDKFIAGQSVSSIDEVSETTGYLIRTGETGRVQIPTASYLSSTETLNYHQIA